jgi:hypothetical protein
MFWRGLASKMRPSRWFAGFSGVAATVGAIAAGCGGGKTQAIGQEAGAEASSDNSTGGTSGSITGGSGSSSGSGSGSEVVDGPPDCGSLADVSVTTYDSGAAWACYQSHCAAEFARCATEACCNNAILTAVQCVGLGGSDNICFTAAIGSARTDSGAIDCILSVYYGGTMCSPGEGGSEGGSTIDASDGGAPDASGE